MEVGAIVVIICFCTLIALTTLGSVKRCNVSIKESEKEIIKSQKEISHTLNEVNTSMKVMQYERHRDQP